MKPPDPGPGVPAGVKGITYKALLGVFETFAKEKPGATNDEHIALGLMFLCTLRDGDDVRRRAFESDVLERLAKLEERDGQLIGNGETEHGDRVLVHVGHPDSLARYGTGHPSEKSCATCGRPTFDQPKAIVVNGNYYCSAACHDASFGGEEARRPLYVGDGAPRVRRYEPEPEEPT